MTEIKTPRTAKRPLGLPSGVDAKIDGQNITVKGPKGELTMSVHSSVSVAQGDEGLELRPVSKGATAMTGTMYSLVSNMIKGVTDGFQKKLQLVGVGYRASAKGKSIDLSLGFSHPVKFDAPEGITIETPSQTEIVVSGIDKQLVGQVAAKLRSYRPPEPYKGKGVRYADEYVLRKEAKKK